MGRGTSNQAELLAVREALLWAPREPFELLVDSKYAEGMIFKNWRITANLDLIVEIKGLVKAFPQLKVTRVKGHAGVLGNELADQAAA